MSKNFSWTRAGAIAGVIATMIAVAQLISAQIPPKGNTAQTIGGSQTSYGDQSPNVGNVQGNVQITYNKEIESSDLVLTNPPYNDDIPLMPKPDLTTPLAQLGVKTHVKLLGSPVDGGLAMRWVKIEVLDGPSQGKTGWVVARAVPGAK